MLVKKLLSRQIRRRRYLLVKTAYPIFLVENHPSFSMFWGGQWNSMGNISDVMRIIANEIIG